MQNLTIKDQEIKILFNGIKVNGELNKGSWHFENYDGQTYINFYATWYTRLPNIIKEIANVKNDTDSMTDYFDTDRFRIYKDHIFFKPAAEAVIKNYTRRIKSIENKKVFTVQYKKEKIDEVNQKINFIKNFITNL